MTPTTWGIVGRGWLGQALVGALEARGVNAWGTRRAEFTFGRDPFPPTPADVLVLNTPPLTSLAPAAYARALASRTDERVIFVSSTSVYGDGASTERTPPTPATSGARWLVEVEARLREHFGARLTIVRPGGLIGPDRHPVHALTRPGPAVLDGPVNLIDRADLIEVLLILATRPVPLVNAVAPHHPDKSIYYGEWAGRLGLGPVRVDRARRQERIIDSVVLPGLGVAWRNPRLDEAPA